MRMSRAGEREFAVYAEHDSIRRGMADLAIAIAAGFDDGAELLGSHLDAYEELIPHVFFGEVSGYVLECSAEVARRAALVAVAGALEAAIAGAAAIDSDGAWWLYLENLLFVSWFEAIEVEPAILTSFVAESGPLVTQQYEAYVKASELYWRIYRDRSMTPERAARLVLQADRNAAGDGGPPEGGEDEPLN